MEFLVAYASTDGMTAEIAQRIGQRLRAADHVVEISEIAQLPRDFDIAHFDAVLIGASVHAHGYQHRVRRFVVPRLPALRAKPTAFFSVCMAIASKDPGERAEAEEIPERWAERLGWAPQAIEVIAGAVRFTRYGFLRKAVMLAIARREMTGPVDPTRDYILTDWQQVDAFANTFAELAQARVARMRGVLRVAPPPG